MHFFPKIGIFDFVSERDVILIYDVIQEAVLNLLALMMHQIRETASRAKPCLPYSMALTLVFREFGVSLERETTHALLHSNT